MSDNKIRFSWKGLDKNKKKATGVIEADNIAKAKLMLRGQGIRVDSINKEKKPFKLFKPKVKQEDLIIFTRQLEIMLQSGVPLLTSLRTVRDGFENLEMQKVIKSVTESLEAGNNFSGSLKKHPKVFDELYCNLIESGENSGQLDNMLGKVALYQEKSQMLKAKIKKALSYPIVVLVISFLITIGLLVKVVPQFAATFSGFGKELPAFTQIVLNMSEFTQANVVYILGAFVGLIIAFNQALKNKRFQRKLDEKILKVPVIGEIMKFSSIAKFARTMATTFASGVPMLDCLTASAGSVGNIVYMEKIFEIKDAVQEGQQLNFAMKNSGIFPSMVVQMAAIGEESGNVDKMLDKAANTLEDKVDNLVDGLTSMIEPMVMAILGVIIGGLIIAMYLPMFEMGSAVN